MADRIGQHDMARAAIDGGHVQPFDRLRESPRCILRDVHDRKPALDAVRHGFLRSSQEVVHRPVFHVLTDHAGTEECRGINCDSRLVGDIPYRVDILNCRSRRAIRTDFQTAARNLLRESQRIGIGARAGAG